MGRHSSLSRTFPDTAGAARRTWPTAGPLPEDAAAKGTSPAGLRAVREQPEGLASVWPDQGLRWGRSGGAMGDGGGTAALTSCTGTAAMRGAWGREIAGSRMRQST